MNQSKFMKCIKNTHLQDQIQANYQSVSSKRKAARIKISKRKRRQEPRPFNRSKTFNCKKPFLKLVRVKNTQILFRPSKALIKVWWTNPGGNTTMLLTKAIQISRLALMASSKKERAKTQRIPKAWRDFKVIKKALTKWYPARKTSLQCSVT